jgi:CYTH domain-containing protein
MAVERRFVLASSLARLLQHEGGPADRIVEAYFPARSDRTQFVRVARNQGHLVLSSSGADRQVSEEAVEVPLSHAEALVEVAAGTIAFDRIAVSLGRGVEGVLDRYILPQGLDLLTITIVGDPRTFAPLLWLGPEVTGDAAFEARELAISGLPAVEEVEVTNAALDALLDTLEGRGAHRSRAHPAQQARRPEQPVTPPAAQWVTPPNRDDAVTGGNALADAAVSGEDELRAAGEKEPMVQAHETSPSMVEDAAAFAPEETNSGAAGAGDEQGPSAGLPDVQDGPSLERLEPAGQRRPVLRTNIRELDDGIARLARSLAPRGPQRTR